jgi:hypothetical protein
MSPKADPCGSACKRSGSCRLFLCARCRDQVVLCRTCDRGQIYCGRECSLDARRHNQREARSRYQASDRGRQLHAERSRRYRANLRRVTDHGLQIGTAPEIDHASATEAAMSPQPSVDTASRPANACHRCGRQTSGFVRLSPIRRPRSRRIATHSGPLRRRRRQKTTDPDRR